jgi:hypothetical protein
VLEVRDSIGNILIANDDANGTPCSQLSILLTSGTYYVAVRHFDIVRGTIANYYLDISL